MTEFFSWVANIWPFPVFQPNLSPYRVLKHHLRVDRGLWVQLLSKLASRNRVQTVSAVWGSVILPRDVHRTIFGTLIEDPIGPIQNLWGWGFTKTEVPIQDYFKLGQDLPTVDCARRMKLKQWGLDVLLMNKYNERYIQAILGRNDKFVDCICYLSPLITLINCIFCRNLFASLDMGVVGRGGGQPPLHRVCYGINIWFCECCVKAGGTEKVAIEDRISKKNAIKGNMRLKIYKCVITRMLQPRRI